VAGREHLSRRKQVLLFCISFKFKRTDKGFKKSIIGTLSTINDYRIFQILIFTRKNKLKIKIYKLYKI